MAELMDKPLLNDCQKYVWDICVKRGWDKRTVFEKMTFLTEEVDGL